MISYGVKRPAYRRASKTDMVFSMSGFPYGRMTCCGNRFACLNVPAFTAMPNDHFCIVSAFPQIYAARIGFGPAQESPMWCT
ncbi:MAG: hypothetical protein R2854_02820 [Caldilineaceae bacterium]